MRLLEQAGGLVQCDQMLLRRRSREVIELSEQSAAQMRHVRGADMAMIFQEPMTSLNPVFTVGEQIAESIRLHQNASREEAMVEAKRMLIRYAFRRHKPFFHVIRINSLAGCASE